MKKFGTLLFGGAFNPPTIAHVLNVKYLSDTLCYDNFIVFPTGNPPHKELECLDDETRFLLSKKVFEEINDIKVSDIEFKMQGESYTYRTLHEFKKKYDDLHLIIGMDSFLSFSKWKNVDEILELSNIVVLKRGGYDFKETEIYLKHKDKFTFIDNPVFEMSSTFVRERLKNGDDIRFYVTDKCYEFLKKFDFKEICGCTQEKKY